jgi:hypothetical protein
MRYSKKRIAVIGCLWLVVGVFAVSVYGLPQMPGLFQEAEGAVTCGAEPCMFPVERHTGGIVLGVGKLEGKDIKTFTQSGYPSGSDPVPGIDTPLPPERNSGQTVNGEQVDETVGLGVNNVQAGKFFLYKSWKYNDGTSGEGNADVYMWVYSTDASLETRNGNTGCGDDSQGFSGSEDCDLLLNAGELSAGYFDAEVRTDSILLPDPLGTGDGELASPRYWIDDPEEDNCGLLDLGAGFPFVSLCLALIEDGGITGISELEQVDVELFNFMTRAHYAKALPSNGLDKQLVLKDAYLEIRHGKGNDRSRIFPQGEVTPEDQSDSQDRANDWQKPIPPGAPSGDETRKHGVRQGFQCEGGPDGDTTCQPSSARTGGSESDGGYDDVHR